MFATPTIHQTGVNNYAVTHGDDKLLFPEFYDREFMDEAASREAGRPIHKTLPYIKILFAGDKTKVIDRPIDMKGTLGGAPPDPQRWPTQWAAYQSQSSQVPDGTSLLEWPPLPRSEAKDLKSMGIHTVEQLAGLPDTSLSWLGAMDWRNKAKAWLLQAADPASIMKMQAENDRLRSDVEMLKQQIQDLANLKTPDNKINTLKLKPKGEE